MLALSSTTKIPLENVGTSEYNKNSPQRLQKFGHKKKITHYRQLRYYDAKMLNDENEFRKSLF